MLLKCTTADIKIAEHDVGIARALGDIIEIFHRVNVPSGRIGSGTGSSVVAVVAVVSVPVVVIVVSVVAVVAVD